MSASLLRRVPLLAAVILNAVDASAQAATVGGQVLAIGTRAPLAAVQVVAADAKGRYVDSARTDRSGSFYITLPSEGEYILRFGQRDLWFDQSQRFTVERDAFHQGTYLLVDHSSDRLPTAADVEQGPQPIRNNQAPRYPEALRNKRIQGAALVRLTITSEGRVARASASVASASAADFGAAVLAVLYNWHFEPATIGGKPVPVLVCMPTLFTLTGPSGQTTDDPRLDSLIASWPTKDRCPP